MAMAGKSRRDFLKSAGAGAAVLVLGGCTGIVERRAKLSRAGPNVMFIISDEHNASVTSCYGNKIVHTPNLDYLAGQGITFNNCYCNSPLCVPSRLAFTAGKYISRTGAWSNNCWLPSDDYPSIARIMNAAGYESYLCGKMHFDATRRYGFTEIGRAWTNQNQKTGREKRRDADNLKPKPGYSQRFNDFHPGQTSGVIRHDRKATEETAEFLRTRRAGQKPFFLVVGYLAPHFPIVVPQRYWQRYKGKVPMPVIPKSHLESQPLNYKHLRIAFNVEDAPDDVVRRGRELYYGFVQWVDEQIGQVLAALKESEIAENTVVIYTADHGENMGEHGLWWKNCMYEHSARVPLIVSWPARWKGGQRRTGVCSLVDVAQTIAELGRAGVPGDWDGDSMLGWLDDAATVWKDRAVSEYYAHNIASGFAMLREGRYKYVYHTQPDEDHPAEQELYDLWKDPGEFNNLAEPAEYRERVAAMDAALVAELGERPETIERRCRVDYAGGYERGSGGKV